MSTFPDYYILLFYKLILFHLKSALSSLYRLHFDLSMLQVKSFLSIYYHLLHLAPLIIPPYLNSALIHVLKDKVSPWMIIVLLLFFKLKVLVHNFASLFFVIYNLFKFHFERISTSQFHHLQKLFLTKTLSIPSKSPLKICFYLCFKFFLSL